MLPWAWAAVQNVALSMNSHNASVANGCRSHKAAQTCESNLIECSSVLTHRGSEHPSLSSYHLVLTCPRASFYALRFPRPAQLSWLLEEVVRDEQLVATVVEEAFSARKEEPAPTGEPLDLFALSI